MYKNTKNAFQLGKRQFFYRKKSKNKKIKKRLKNKGFFLCFLNFFLRPFFLIKYLAKKVKIWYNFKCKKGDAMKIVKIHSDSIKLGQFIKFLGIVSTGGEIKNYLLENTVKVNENTTESRGKTLFKGDIVEINGEKFIVEVENDN